MRNHRTCMLFAVLLVACVTISGCGGGGGGGDSSTSGTTSATPTTSTSAAPAQPVAPSASPANAVARSTTPNVQPIEVAEIATGTRNILQTSVTICVPGTSMCQTIDNVDVDTGSQGLRILAAALSPSLTLPAVNGSGGSRVAACTVFGSGYTWGSVRTADVRLAGEVAAATSIQVIADPAVPAARP